MLEYHINICKEKKKLDMQKLTQTDNQKYTDLQLQINQLKKELEETKTRSVVANTNNTINITNFDNSTHNYGSILTYMTPEVVKETFEKNYKLEDFFGAQKALAEFTTKNFLMGKNKALYLCKDKARNRFSFTDEDKNEIEDLNAAILIKLVSKGFGVIKNLYTKESAHLQGRLARFERCDNGTMMIETRNQMKRLEEVYKQIVNIIKEGDGYRNQLSRSLPATIESRICIDDIDEKMEQIETNDEDEKAEENKIEHQPTPVELKKPILHDKTLRHIGNITYGKLRLYKNHFQKTGELTGPPTIMADEEDKKKFLEFMHSDE
jgi:O6-methylguanine-DNA--protein-cysteine methyltransferase